MQRRWRAAFGGIVGGCLLAAVVHPASATLPATSTWIVTVAPGIDPEVAAPALVTTVGGALGHVFANVLGGFSVDATALEAAALGADPRVASVVPDGALQLPVEETHAHGAGLVPTGVARIAASPSGGGPTGAGVTVAVIDSGIDLVHPDLAPNLSALGTSCVSPFLTSQDDNSHGTHVAGTIAAADDGIGVVGVAPDAELVPVKAFDAQGASTWATVICGIDYVAAHADVIDVANMSFGDLSSDATACDGVTTSAVDALRQSICDLVSAGVIAVAAAGNNAVDVAGFVPAAFPETIAVSALTDTDGEPGGIGGCIVEGALCDDTFSNIFSNFGARIDVMAPGFEILSTMPGGLYATKDGTSMAAPHVAGTVARMLEADPDLTLADVRTRLHRTGECPDGTSAGGDGTCAGQGAWDFDTDGVAEPLVRIDREPSVTVADPAASSTVAGTVTVRVDAADDHTPVGALSVDVRVDGGSWHVATWNAVTSRYEWAWSTLATTNGAHAVDTRATDAAAQTALSSPVSVTVANLMHVGDLDATSSRSKKSWRANVTVTVHGAGEALLSGATVSFTWSGGATGTGTCTTGRKGTCTVTSAAIANTQASASATVTAVSRTSQTYTPASNHDPDGSSNGTTIVQAH